MKNRSLRSRLAAAAVLAGTLAIVPQMSGVQASSTIVVATRGFTEVQIAGYLYADLLKHHGFKVDTSHFTFGTEVQIVTALEHNQVDLIPDYLGNGLEVDLGKQYHPGDSSFKVWKQVDAAFKARYNIRWLRPAFKFNDQNVFVTRKRTASRYSLHTLTNLAAQAPKLRFAVLQECTTRTDCLKGFNRIYHPKRFKELFDTSLAGTSPTHPPFYDDLLKGKFDVVQGYGTTDAPIAHYNLVALIDNKHMFPPDQLSPVIRGSVLSANPSIQMYLNQLETHLTTANFRHMNALVAFRGKQAKAVADAFLRRHNLI